MTRVRYANRHLCAMCCAAVIVLSAASGVLGRRIPAHPAALRYDSLAWQVPSGAPYRRDLGGGLVAYVAEDRALPLVVLRGHVRYGSMCEPAGKEGLTALYTQLLRSGGTTEISADTLDMLLDLFAINVSVVPSDTRIEFHCSFLSDYADTALALLGRMLMMPAFEMERFVKERDALLERIRHRFANPGPILTAAHAKAMYAGGANSRLPTSATVNAISREDIAALHRTVYHRRNVVLAASGAFDESWMIGRLQHIVPADSTGFPTPFPAVACRSDQRLLLVPKALNQAYVRMSLPMFQRPHADYYACAVLNHILGGGAFSSRLSASVRSDAGLTYDIHSEVVSSYMYPGTFYAHFFTKTGSTLEAIRMVLAELEKVRESGVTLREVESAKKVLIDGLPSMFRSKEDIVEHYSWNEYYGRSINHYQAYPDSVRAVTPEAVLAVARKYLVPESLTYVIVADTAALFAADTISGLRLRSLSPMRIVPPDSLPALP